MDAVASLPESRVYEYGKTSETLNFLDRALKLGVGRYSNMDVLDYLWSKVHPRSNGNHLT